VAVTAGAGSVVVAGVDSGTGAAGAVSTGAGSSETGAATGVGSEATGAAVEGSVVGSAVVGAGAVDGSAAAGVVSVGAGVVAGVATGSSVLGGCSSTFFFLKRFLSALFKRGMASGAK
jgi:hypothetical protein